MKERKNCLCTAMLYDPVEKLKEAEQKAIEAAEKEAKEKEMTHKASLLERIEDSIKRSLKVISTLSNLVPKYLHL
jgi:hypothetical protein